MVRAALYRLRRRDRSADAAQRPAGGIRRVAMGASRPRRRSRSAVSARGVSRGGAAICEVRDGLETVIPWMNPLVASWSETRGVAALQDLSRISTSSRGGAKRRLEDETTEPETALIRDDMERADRDDVAVAVAFRAVAECVIDGGLFVRGLQRQSRASRCSDRDRAPSR